ncbi:MAG TPA: ferredoxin [Treponema sp.]|jgi:carbon-monoxide dehydrogenase small subunit|nr:ferredoxin [Treponema sp.]HBB42277.1 ferredoxin [Treponema sp.]HCA19676.1 ferredoxin [Treponema sp.]
MQIPFTINGAKDIIKAPPNEKLLTLLRRRRLTSVKLGCTKGFCGNCMVLLNGRPVPSCIIPVGLLRDCEIETLEYFIKNNPVYNDIMSGFQKAGIHLCGYCDAGKIFSTYEIISSETKPEREYIYEVIKHLNPCCTDRDTLANGIEFAWAAKKKREGKKADGK